MADKTAVAVIDVDFTFGRDFDLDAFTAAIEPPEDVRLNHTGDTSSLPLWQAHLLAWGWGAGLSPVRGQALARPYAIGPYGDWTWLEDDVRFMPALAPFANPGSRIVFTVASPPLSLPGNPSFDFHYGPFEAWEFGAGKVTRHSVDKIVSYE